jgi:hypothetical protein
MTFDKIIFYLGKEHAQFLGKLPKTKLLDMMKELQKELMYIKLPDNILFKYKIELNYIKYLLELN